MGVHGRVEFGRDEVAELDFTFPDFCDEPFDVGLIVLAPTRT